MCMGGGDSAPVQQAPPPPPPPPPPRVLEQAAPEPDANNNASASKRLQSQATGLKKYRNDLSISNALGNTGNNSAGNTNGLGISM